MVKRGNSKPSRTAYPSGRFDIESSPWLVAGAFAAAFLLLVILFREFIFSDKMLFGSDMMQAGYFYREFLVKYIHENWSFPMWDPYIFGGIPFVDAFHGDILYPGTAPGKLIAALFDNLYRILGWNFFWHIFLSGLFMYACAREFALSKIASIVAGVSYMFTGYLISLVAPGHDGKIFVTALFPLAMLFLHRGFDRRPLLNFSLLGLVIGSIILTPHLQMSYFTLWALALYTVYRLVYLLIEKQPIVKTAITGSLVVWAVIIGLGLSAIQFLPGYIYTSEYSPRSDTKKGWDWSTSWSMHEEEAFSLLIPEFSGTSSSSAKTYYWGKNAFKDNSEAVGIIPLFLALIGIFYSRRKERWFFVGLALFALSYALASTTPLYNLYFLIPKVASMRAAAMIMFLFCFCIAMLAGMGVQRLLDLSKEREKLPPKFSYLLFGFPGFMFLLALLFSSAGKGMLNLWTAVFYSEAGNTMVQQGISKLDVAYANLPAIQTGAWWGFFFVSLSAGLIWLYRERKAGPVILLGLALLAGVDGIRFGSRFVATIDFKQQFFSDPTTSFLAGRAENSRVMDLRQPMRSLQSLDLPLHDVAVPVGYHGNQLRWYDKLLGNVVDPKTGQQRFDNPNILNKQLINLMGVKYLILPNGRSLPQEFFGPKPVTVVRTIGQAQIIDNQNAFPRAFLTDSVEIVPENIAIVADIISGGADLSRIAYLEEQPELPIVREIGAIDTAIGLARIVDYGINSIVIETNAPGNRMLVLTDVWYDAWKVTIDAKPAKCIRTDGALRGVAVPAGKHNIEFRYESKRYELGKTITGVTALYLLLVVVVAGIQDRRKGVIEKVNDK